MNIKFLLPKARGFIEKGKMPTVQDVIASDVYPDMPAEWYVVYRLQAIALKKYLGPRKGFQYSRDKGMMPFIERHATKLGVSTKDAWNPMDVLLTKKSLVAKIEREVKKTTSVVELNNWHQHRISKLIVEKLFRTITGNYRLASIC